MSTGNSAANTTESWFTHDQLAKLQKLVGPLIGKWVKIQENKGRIPASEFQHVVQGVWDEFLSITTPTSEGFEEQIRR